MSKRALQWSARAKCTDKDTDINGLFHAPGWTRSVPPLQYAALTSGDFVRRLPQYSESPPVLLVARHACDGDMKVLPQLPACHSYDQEYKSDFPLPGYVCLSLERHQFVIPISISRFSDPISSHLPRMINVALPYNIQIRINATTT